MADWTKPTLTSTYTNFLSEVTGRDSDLAVGLDPAVTTVTSPPTNAIRWNSASNRWEKYNGTTWGTLSATFAFTAISTTGNASVGGTLTVTGTTTLGTATATTPATADNSTNVATTAYVRAQAYAPLASPALTGTPTAPTAAVDTNTTQVATTAFVVGQGYLKSSTASSTYAPIASPTFTGTVTGPSFIPNSATVPTNGLYLPAANTVGIATASTGRVFVDASGNVGIGTSSPNSRLHCFGGDIYLGSGSYTQNLDTALRQLRLYTNNNSSPIIKLGAAYSAQFLNVSWFRTYVNAAVNGSLVFESGSGSVNDGSNNEPATWTERLRIDSSGNVGIGTSSPSERLTVAPSSGAAGILALAPSGNAAFIEAAGPSSVVRARLQSNSAETWVGTITNHPLWFATNNTERLRIDSSGDITATGNMTFTGTGFLDLPAGTTAQRPASPSAGMIRYNSTLGQFEGYTSAWGSIGGGATGGGSDRVFNLNGQTVTTDYTVPSGQNASSAGPITISSGITVTISSGSNWAVI